MSAWRCAVLSPSDGGGSNQDPARFREGHWWVPPIGNPLGSRTAYRRAPLSALAAAVQRGAIGGEQPNRSRDLRWPFRRGRATSCSTS